MSELSDFRCDLARVKVLCTSLCMLALLLPVNALAQASFQSAGTGVWNNASTWTLMSGTDADGLPDSNDDVRILALHTITVGTATRDCANLIVDAGGTLSIETNRNVQINANPGSATINGRVVMSSTGRLTENGAGTRTLTLGSGGILTISGTAANPSFDSFNFDQSSTVEYMASANQTVMSGVGFGRLTLGGSDRKTVGPIPTDTTFTCNSKLTVGSGVTLDVSTNILYINFNGDVENNGTIDASIGTTVVEMRGALWTNNGVFLPSVTPGFGHQPTVTFHDSQIGGTTAVQRFFDVRINGTADATVSIDSARNIDILTGAALTTGAGASHSLTGNWLNSGTFDCGNATVTLLGTAAQSVAASSFYHLVVNNPAGVTLTGNVTIGAGGSLTLQNGNLNTGSYSLIVNNTNTNALVLGTNQILGTVTRAIAPGSTGAYEFFSSNAYVTPGGLENPASITASAYPGVFPPNLAVGADTSVIVKRYYSLSQAGAGPSFTFALHLPYLQSEVRGNELNYVLWRNGGSGWTNMGSIIVDPTNNFVEQANLTSFSDWAIAEDNAALPIQLAYFSATAVPGNDAVRCNWRTISETNNYGFILQRSTNTPDAYEDLPNSFVPGHGTTLEPQDYSWNHQGVSPGRYCYRLKQIDLDGTIYFSEGVEVIVSSLTGTNTTESLRSFSLAQNYPNPFNPSTNVEFRVEEYGQTSLEVFNILGEQVATLFSGKAEAGRTYSVWFDATGLPNGVYLYKLVSNEKSLQRKMILVK